MAFLEKFAKVFLGATSVSLGAMALITATADESQEGKDAALLMAGASLLTGGVCFADSVTDALKPPAQPPSNA